MSASDQFVQRFQEMWRAPTPEGFAALFHLDGRFQHPEMPELLPASMAADYMRGVQQAIPDISLRVRNWAASQETVLIEWTQSGTVGGQSLTWSGADRFTLRNGLAIEGVAYFDPTPVLDALKATSRV